MIDKTCWIINQGTTSDKKKNKIIGQLLTDNWMDAYLGRVNGPEPGDATLCI